MCEMMPVGNGAPDRVSHRLTALAVADELLSLTTALSDLAYDLGDDPATVRKHMGSLQSIDLITQIHLALADLLRSEAPLADRLAQVPVESLGQRLQARMLNDGLVGERTEVPPPNHGKVFL